MASPRSCDTFVALPPVTAEGCVIFGKNSDRMDEEVQEVIHVPAMDHPAGSKVQCTYIEIDQVPHTHAVILSRPSWLWGAEMGSNEHGVCIGNEAVWTRNESTSEEKLLGMDLLRLALERADGAKSAMDVITSLLAEHGQGGPEKEDPSPSDKGCHHHSFLICDPREAWILETAGGHWAAEHVTNGVRNISNQLTIGTKIDAMSPGLQEYAQSQGWWNPDQGDFHFGKAFSENYESPEAKPGRTPSGRQQWGARLLQDLSQDNAFGPASMMRILRDTRSGICMEGGGFCSTGSQVSVLPAVGTGLPACHWFTGTPNPARSLFKPFIFTYNCGIGEKTRSPSFGDEDPARQIPRFQRTVDRRHELWKGHEKLMEMLDKEEVKGQMILEQMLQMEEHCVEDMMDLVKNFDEKAQTRAQDIFQHMVNLELNFYK